MVQRDVQLPLARYFILNIAASRSQELDSRNSMHSVIRLRGRVRVDQAFLFGHLEDLSKVRGLHFEVWRFARFVLIILSIERLYFAYGKVCNFILVFHFVEHAEEIGLQPFPILDDVILCYANGNFCLTKIWHHLNALT